MCDVCRTCADVSKIFYYHPKSVASQNVVLAPKSSQSVGHACGRFIFLVPLEGSYPKSDIGHHFLENFV